jgi:translation initiation factor IF-1
MKNDNSIKYVIKCVEKISDIFSKNEFIFFSESDLQSYLFSLLLEKFYDKFELETFVWGTDKPKKVKKIFTGRLHSEFLLPNGRIDLAILDIANVKFSVNSKGRNSGFRINDGNHIFIEIKASQTSRSSITSKNKWTQLIISDIEKLNSFQNPCFMVCFEYEQLLDTHEIELIQQKANSNVKFYYIKSSFENSYFE